MNIHLLQQLTKSRLMSEKHRLAEKEETKVNTNKQVLNQLMNERQKTESTDQVIASLKVAHQRELARCKEDYEA